MQNKGYTLIEVIVTFTILMFAISLFYQTSGMVTSRIFYLERESREIDYMADYSNSITYELKNLSQLISNKPYEIGRDTVECYEKQSLSTRYLSCPYKDYIPYNPNIETVVPGVSLIVFNSGLVMLVPR